LLHNIDKKDATSPSMFVLSYHTRNSAIAETAHVTISDSGRSANPNHNPEYDLSLYKLFFTNRVVNRL